MKKKLDNLQLSHIFLFLVIIGVIVHIGKAGYDQYSDNKLKEEFLVRRDAFITNYPELLKENLNVFDYVTNIEVTHKSQDPFTRGRAYFLCENFYIKYELEDAFDLLPEKEQFAIIDNVMEKYYDICLQTTRDYNEEYSFWELENTRGEFYYYGYTPAYSIRYYSGEFDTSNHHYVFESDANKSYWKDEKLISVKEYPVVSHYRNTFDLKAYKKKYAPKASEYSDFEEFYDDYYDDFEGIDDAETYYEEYFE